MRAQFFAFALANFFVFIGANSASAQIVTGVRVLDESFAIIGQPQTIAAGHTGQDSAVVVVEFTSVDYLTAVDNNGERMFGDCVDPAWVTTAKQTYGNDWWLEKGHLGYAPSQGSGETCRVAWVQCIGFGYDGYSKCGWPPEPSPSHQQEVAAIVAKTAPDAKIIFLHQGPNFFSETVPSSTPQALRGTIEWMLKSGYQNFSDFDPSLTPAEQAEWLAILQTEFNNESPIEKWNIKAVNMSWDGLKSGPLGGYNNNVKYFSDYCSVNPGEPFNPDKYLDDMRVFGWCGTSPTAECEATERAKGADYDLTDAFAELRAAGVLPIAAGANQNAYMNGHSWPGCTKGALTVSSVWDGHSSNPASATNIYGATHPTMNNLLAPSPHIGMWHSAYPQTTAAVSFALPIVAASAAILGGSSLLPDATAAQLEYYLRETADPVIQDRSCTKPAGTPNCPDSPPYGYPVPGYEVPRLNLFAAANAASEKLDVAVEINPFSNGLIPASSFDEGELTTALIKTTQIANGESVDFDATTITAGNIKFGPLNGDLIFPYAIWETDADGDSDMDALFGFNARDAGVVCGQPSMGVQGTTLTGEFFAGQDDIVTPQCPECHPQP